MDYQQREALKQKVKIGGIGVVAGGVAWWIVLVSILGWVSPTTVQQQTSNAVQTKVDQVLAPFCADRFMANKDALAKFTKAGEGTVTLIGNLQRPKDRGRNGSRCDCRLAPR